MTAGARRDDPVYEHLNGSLVSAAPGRAVVECGGVGYLVRIPLSTFEKLPEPGTRLKLLTHLHLREDSMELFGFASDGERVLFRKLLSVSGVGPGVALALMSQHRVADIIGALRREDPRPLMLAKGVGRKTAERVVLELKGCVAELEALAGAAAPEAEGEADVGVLATAVQAMVALGYAEADAHAVAREVVKDLGEAPVGEVLREALRRVR